MITASPAATIQQSVEAVPVFTPPAIAQSGTDSLSISTAVEQSGWSELPPRVSVELFCIVTFWVVLAVAHPER